MANTHTHTHTHTYIYIYIYIYTHTHTYRASQVVKNQPAMQETQVLSLGQEDPLVERMATNSSIPVLAWEIPWTEESGRL